MNHGTIMRSTLASELSRLAKKIVQVDDWKEPSGTLFDEIASCLLLQSTMYRNFPNRVRVCILATGEILTLKSSPNFSV
jgi:hypothetical protein